MRVTDIVAYDRVVACLPTILDSGHAVVKGRRFYLLGLVVTAYTYKLAWSLLVLCADGAAPELSIRAYGES